MVTDADDGGHLFHLALRSDWAAARVAGDYRVSTLGRNLAEEGFLHASFAHQWEGVRAAFYRDVTEPLLLLEVDPELLDAPVVVEVPDGAQEAFPHIYGPLPVTAVVAAWPVTAASER